MYKLPTLSKYQNLKLKKYDIYSLKTIFMPR